MFPVVAGVYEYVDISKERNPKYRDLLRAEYPEDVTISKHLKQLVRNLAGNKWHQLP